MANRRELVVALVSDASQYNRGFNQATNSTKKFDRTAEKASGPNSGLGRMQSRMDSLSATAKFAIAGAATAAVTGFARDSIRAASDLQESLNAVDKTFGTFADGINEIGRRSAESFGLSQSSFNEFAVRFSNFADTVANESGRSVVNVMEEITGRVSDFASVMNLDVSEAAEKFQSGLAGQTEVLRQFGIDVSAAATTQKALELGLADTASELTEQQKILARYAIIMEETDKFAGDFKDTQDDLANATRTASAQMEDFQAQVGQFALPILGEFVQMGSDAITVLDGLTNGLSGATGAGFSFIGFLEKAFPPTLLLTEGLESLADWLGETEDSASSAASAVSQLTDAERRARQAIAARTASAPPTFTAPSSGGSLNVRAHGGPVASGRSYLVGERGPELFVPNQGGQIIPNNQISSTSNMENHFHVLPENLVGAVQRELLLSNLGRWAEVN